MKTALKITSVLSIIYGIHYIALGIISLLGAGLGALVTIATFSTSLIGGTLGLILCIILCLGLAYLYGFGGIYALKNNRKPALKLTAIAAAVAILFFIITLISKKLPTSFPEVISIILPIVHGFLIIQTVD